MTANVSNRRAASSGKRTTGDARLAALERCAVLVLGVYLAGVGINILTHGEVMYSNAFRWRIDAPSAVIIGIILIVVSFRVNRAHV